MKWFPKYIPVPNPAENKTGWKFPYSNGEWPDKSGWYWVWTGKYPSTPAVKAWWDNSECRFLAVKDIMAWHNAVELK